MDLITKCLKHVSRVIVLPCGFREDKHTMSSPQLRFQMCETAVASLNRPEVSVSDRELRNGPMMSSYRVWKEFQDSNPEDKYQFVIGVDLLPTLIYWDDPEQTINETEFLVFNRVGYEIPQEYKTKPNYEYHDDEIIEMSSTHVRGTVSSFDPSSGTSFVDYMSQLNLVPEGVPAIIESQKLYGINI